jgi:hypothetical protein
MKCVVCGKVKGKRHCPAKNALICATCCGEKRVLEIPCPENCQYLSSGLSYQTLKKRVSKLQQQDDPFQRRKYYEVHEQFGHILGQLEEAIILYSRGLRSLRDEQVRDAVKLVRETYLTEQKGVIYEHTSTDPLVNALARDIMKACEEHRQIKEGEPFLRTGDALACLDVLLADVEYHLGKKPGEDTYLSFIKRSRPDIAQTPSQNLII